MTTRRERKEARLARRQRWTESAQAEAARRFDAASQIADGIPLGQPILVGHHSEARHRRELGRVESNMRHGVEAQQRAEHHQDVAANIATQLDRSVFSDDADAAERLRERIAEREAQLARRKKINTEIRKGAGWLARLTPPLTDEERRDLESAARYSNCAGYPAYALTNLSATIRRDRARLEKILTEVPPC